jgi:thioredoxin-related protein
MKIVATIALILITMYSSAQEINKKILDKTHNKEILINHCTRAGLISFPEFKEMYNPLYESYSPDAVTMIELKKLIKKQKIKIILGTWCSDSKVNVPNFYKILDALKFKEKNIEIIAVDGLKKAENGIIDNLDIVSVPTFIFYDKNGVEIGRIIEHPKKTLEADFLAILKNQDK